MTNSVGNPDRERSHSQHAPPCLDTGFFRQQGADNEELLRNYPTLTKEDLSAAWSYYEQHREECDSEADAGEAEYQAIAPIGTTMVKLYSNAIVAGATNLQA